MRSSSPTRFDLLTWSGAALVVCLASAAICVSRVNLEFLPAVALGLGALGVGVLSFTSPYVRLVGYIGGALVVMQSSSSGTGALKPVYLAFVVFSGVVGALNTFRLSPRLRSAFRPLFAAGIVVLSVTTVEIAISLLAGVDASRVLRDATTYLMVAASPFIASDAARVGSPKRGLVTIAVFSLLTTVGFAVFWVSARGAGDLGIERLGMLSFMVPSCGFMVGLAYGLVRRKPLWVVIAVVCLLGILVTGTRSGLLMLVGMAALFGPRGARKVPAARMVVGLAALGAALVVALPLLISTVASEDFFVRRASALVSIFSDGISSDQSGAIRLRAFSITIDVWSGHPLFGVGFGYLFPSPVDSLPPADFQLDSPALVLSKFGLLGTFALLVAVILMALGIARFHRSTGFRSEVQAAGLGLILIGTGVAFLGMPMEDKGFGLAFALIYLMLGLESRADLMLDHTGSDPGVLVGPEDRPQRGPQVVQYAPVLEQTARIVRRRISKS